MKVVKNNAEIDAARQTLLSAVTQQSRFDIAVAVEGLVQTLIYSAFGEQFPDAFEDKQGETCVEVVQREDGARALARAAETETAEASEALLSK